LPRLDAGTEFYFGILNTEYMATSSFWQRFQRNDRRDAWFEVEDGITSVDYLQISARGAQRLGREGTGINPHEHSAGGVI